MYVTKRSGFAMIMAIFVVFLIAMGGALLMRSSTQESKAVGDKYIRAQAQLLAKSATEYAVMRIQGFNAAGCLNQLNITVYNSGGQIAGNEMFDINVSMNYSFRGVAPGGTCNILASSTGKDSTVLMDVTVTDHNLGTEPIRINERSWQKF